MKIFTTLLLLIPFLGFSQTTNLLISEYAEGAGGNRKYVEIYNGTGADVNLENFQIWKTVNGSVWAPVATLTLTGTLADGSAYVIANNNTDVVGADVYNTNINWNGDDAVGLAWNGGTGTNFTLIDVVGFDGTDPGDGFDVAGEALATKDKVLYRKPSVCSPTTDWTLSAGTDAASSQWIVSTLAYNATNEATLLTDFGIHTANCASSPCTTIPAPTATGASICGGAIATLAATATETNGVLSWFDVATGGTAVGTGTSFVTPAITATTSYWVEEAVTGCPASARTEVIATVTGTAPTVDAGSNVSVCTGQSVTLTATGTGTITWDNNVAQGVAFVPTQTTTYTVTIADGACTNTDNVTVTVNALPIAVATVSNSTTITATPAGLTYQWINCTTNAPIANQTAATYLATVNGSYAVIATNSTGCVDTSACVTINQVGIEDNTAENTISIYPNPTKGKVTVSLAENQVANVVVYNALGKVVSTYGTVQNGNVLDLTATPAGIYLVKVTTDNGSTIVRVVRN